MKHFIYLYNFFVGMVTGFTYFIFYGIVYYVLNNIEQSKNVSNDIKKRNSCFNWGVVIGASIATYFIYMRFFL